MPISEQAGERTLTIRRDDPRDPAFRPLFARHLSLMYEITPPESVHALDPAGLAVRGVAFYGLREGETLLGMGALREIDARHAEIKSMHVVAEARGRGLARRLLEHLIAEARAAGFTRLSLETGVEAPFAPARALYAAAGFEECGPFEGYWDDPNSLFMTRTL